MTQTTGEARDSLDGHDRRRLEAGMRRTGDARAFRRMQAVLLLARGVGAGEAARVTLLTRQSVYNARRRYLLRRDVADLEDAPRSGRPRTAAAVSDARIEREFRRDPLALGYLCT